MNAPVQTKDIVTTFKAQVANNEREFRAALPAHIPVERFMRVVMTAVTNNADLLYADRRSLFESATKAAQDGLLPDGREGALVIYNTKIKDGGKDIWIKKVQWMPMIAGILKKVRNSGELSSIVARVVYQGDRFRNWIDDFGEHIEYEAGEDSDQDVVRKVFAMARLKDGSIEVEVLSPKDVEKIRAASRSKDSGPWVTWWDEMAKKSALRRLSKRLPISTDLDDLIRRDDALYDFEGAREDARTAQSARQQSSLASKLEALATMPAREPDPELAHDAETGKIHETQETHAVETSSVCLPDDGSREPGEVGSAHLPASPPIQDRDKTLVATARKIAEQGSEKFRGYIAKLAPPIYERLEPYFEDLQACADAADKETIGQ